MVVFFCHIKCEKVLKENIGMFVRTESFMNYKYNKSLNQLLPEIAAKKKAILGRLSSMQDVQVNIDAFSSNLQDAIEKKEVRKRCGYICFLPKKRNSEGRTWL